jgi:anaerobic selenocysteine-containing dehydrogenase/ferredoxin-NADP reductase
MTVAATCGGGAVVTDRDFGLAVPISCAVSAQVSERSPDSFASLAGAWIVRFINAFGSPNVADGTEICNWHKDHAHAYTVGRSISSPDFENTHCVVLWGHNPSATWLDHATGTAAAVARGARLIVVDPRRAGFASRADQWLRVRPGSDGALALGIAREMIRSGQFDEPFITAWSNGPLLVRSDTGRFLRAKDLASPPPGSEPDDLVAIDRSWSRPVGYSASRRTYGPGANPALVADADITLATGQEIRCKSAFQLFSELCDEFPPERVEELCWVPKDQVAATARLLFESRPVCYYAWSGLGQHTNATQTDRAISILMALTGSFDKPGGNVQFGKPPAIDVSGGELLSAEQRAKCVGLKRSSLGPGRDGQIGSDALYDAILNSDPYQVRALFDFGRNFLLTHAGVDRGAKALAKLEFFAHADVVLTPTASFADIFLPINTPWEREALRCGFEGSAAAHQLVQLRQAVIPSRGESRSDAFVVFELAKRLGLGGVFWDGDLEAGLAHILRPLSITLDDLRAKPEGISFPATTLYERYKTDGFKTATGKLEIFSETFAEGGQNPLPVFVEPAQSPVASADDRFPLVLTSAKMPQYCHAAHRHAPSLRKRLPDPEISIHPDAAGIRDVENGDWVEITTAHGRARMRAKFDASLNPRVVVGQYGWWQGNAALDLPAFDPFSDGGANYNRLVADDRADPISGSLPLRSSQCDVRPAEPRRDRAWTGWREFRVAKTQVEANEVLSLWLAPTDGEAMASFQGGQHVTLRAEVQPGDVLIRCYSLSAEPDASALRVTVKLARDADGRAGRMSGLLHSLTAGSPARLHLQRPKGSFVLPNPADGHVQLVMAAAGIGITPILAMLYQLRAVEWCASVALLYGVRSGADHAFRREIETLSRGWPKLAVTTFFSAPQELDRRKGAFDIEGRITAAHLVKAGGNSAQFYLCGPSAMIGEISAALAVSGVGAERIRTEAFGPSSRPAALQHDGPQPVHLQKSGVSLLWTPESKSLLGLIEAAIPAASGCRTGQCESCAMPLLEGVVAYPEGVQPPEGSCLPCVGVPLSPLTLDT